MTFLLSSSAKQLPPEAKTTGAGVLHDLQQWWGSSGYCKFQPVSHKNEAGGPRHFFQWWNSSLVLITTCATSTSVLKSSKDHRCLSRWTNSGFPKEDNWQRDSQNPPEHDFALGFPVLHASHVMVLLFACFFLLSFFPRCRYCCAPAIWHWFVFILLRLFVSELIPFSFPLFLFVLLRMFMVAWPVLLDDRFHYLLGCSSSFVPLFTF